MCRITQKKIRLISLSTINKAFLTQKNIRRGVTLYNRRYARYNGKAKIFRCFWR